MGNPSSDSHKVAELEGRIRAEERERCALAIEAEAAKVSAVCAKVPAAAAKHDALMRVALIIRALGEKDGV